MQATLDGIVDQFNRCAVLMSDPVILRRQPHVVADQFMATSIQIETLRKFLPVKEKKTDCCKPWFDCSMLDGGIKSMVDRVLRRHALPLARNFKFPKIFDVELKVLRNGENIVIREIKETNCMGSMVVLYYYLYWHLMLILLNHRNHPCSDTAEDEDWISNLEEMVLKHLPKGSDLLEYRRVNVEQDDGEGDGESDGHFVGSCWFGAAEVVSSDPSTAAVLADAPGPPPPAVTSVTPKSTGAGNSGVPAADATAKAMAAAAIARATDLKSKGVPSQKAAAQAAQALASKAARDAAVFSQEKSSYSSPHDFQKMDKNFKLRYGESPSYFDDSMVDGDVGGASNNTRKTFAIHTYRHVLNSIFEGAPQSVESGSPLESHITCLSADSVLSHAELFGGVLASFNLEDEISKWDDMHRPIQVMSNPENGIGRKGTAVFTYRLANVLKHRPYARNGDQFVRQARKAVVYDYGSVPLMMDICRSSLALSGVMASLVLNDNGIGPSIKHLISQTVGLKVPEYFPAFGDAEFDEELIRPDSTVFHRINFIGVPEKWYKAPCVFPIDDAEEKARLSRITADDLAGKYWGSRPSALLQFNHQYLASPFSKVDPDIGPPFLHKLQYMCEHSPLSRPAVSLFLAKYFLRNSLFTTSLRGSTEKLIDYLKCHVKLQDARPSADNEKGSSALLLDLNLFSSALFLDGGPDRSLELIQGLEKADDSRGKPRHSTNDHLTLPMLKQRLSLEKEALDQYISQFKKKQPDRYPGISWPLLYGKGKEENNYKCFALVRSLPRTVRPLVESVDAIALDTNFMQDLVKAAIRVSGASGDDTSKKILRDMHEDSV